MVMRNRKRNRRYLGTRRWGAGNIKNRRGAGGRGGVGKAGRKHKFTHIVKYERERIGKTGFTRWGRKDLKEIDLWKVSKMAREKKEERPVIELAGYKVLGDGKLEKPAIVRAAAFSASAAEKIKSAGGEPVKL